MYRNIKVMIAEDHSMIREGLKQYTAGLTSML